MNNKALNRLSLIIYRLLVVPAVFGQSSSINTIDLQKKADAEAKMEAEKVTELNNNQ